MTNRKPLGRRANDLEDISLILCAIGIFVGIAGAGAGVALAIAGLDRAAGFTFCGVCVGFFCLIGIGIALGRRADRLFEQMRSPSAPATSAGQPTEGEEGK